MSAHRPILVGSADLLPNWTWEDLEAALTDFAVSDAQRELVRPLVSATRKQARFLPTDQVLKEVLSITFVVGDEGYSAGQGEVSHMT